MTISARTSRSRYEEAAARSINHPNSRHTLLERNARISKGEGTPSAINYFVLEGAPLDKSNKNHVGPGSPEGGQFTFSDGTKAGSKSSVALDQRTKRIQAAGASYKEELVMMGNLGSKGGFTSDAASQRSPHKGFSVAIDETKSLHVNAGTLTADKLAKWQVSNARTLAQKGVKIGGWFDTDDGTVWIDIVHVLPNKKEAVKLARAHNQKSIYDLATKKTINTGGTGLAKSNGTRLFDANTRPEVIVAWANSLAVSKGVADTSTEVDDSTDVDDDDSLEVDEAHSTVMIALLPSRATREALSAISDDPKEQLHCTLVFLGEASGISSDELDSIRESVQEIAGSSWPVPADIESLDLLGPPDEQVSALKLNSQAAVSLQQLLMEDPTIKAVYDRNVENKWPEYLPHVTIGGGDLQVADESMPELLVFDTLSMHVSDTVLEMTLEAEEPEDDAPILKTSVVRRVLYYFSKLNSNHLGPGSPEGGQFTSGPGGARIGRAARRDGTGPAYAGGGSGAAKEDTMPPGDRSWTNKSDAEKVKEFNSLNPREFRRYQKSPASFDHEQAMWQAKMPHGGTPRPLVKNANGKLAPVPKPGIKATLKEPTDGNGTKLDKTQMSEFNSLSSEGKNAYLSMSNNRMRSFTHAQMMSNVTQSHTRDGFHLMTRSERAQISKPVLGSDGKPMKDSWGKAVGNPYTGKPIPPGWAKTLIADNWRSLKSKAGLVVQGIDASGKRQPQYSVAHATQQSKIKFDRIVNMDGHLPKLDAALKRDVGKGNDQADCLLLIRTRGIRPDRGTGSGAQKAYGATSLEARHITSIKGDVVHFKFQAKDGVLMNFDLKNADVAHMLKVRLATRKGTDKLFGYISHDAKNPLSMEHYMRANGIPKTVKVKDLRTYIGNTRAKVLVDAYVKKNGSPNTMNDLKTVRMSVAQEVSQLLGNTPEVVLKSYIDKFVWHSMEVGIKA